MQKKVFFLTLIALISQLPSYAQFTLSGELRPRFELRHGYGRLPASDADIAAFVNQRSRLNLSYESELFNTFVSFQEVRTWGGKGMFDVQPGLGIHQAYAEIPFLENFAVKFGRQELRYNNQRLFAINNWNQNGRTHDALVLKFKDNDFQAHYVSAFNQNEEQVFGTHFNGNSYKSLNYLWLNHKVGKFDLTALGVMDGFQGRTEDKTTQNRFTFGGILAWKPGKNSLELHAYKQNGKTPMAVNIDAWYLHLVARTRPLEKLSVNIGAELFSGNDETDTSNDFRVFDPLYGANHLFNGHMDYFTNIPQHTKGGGLINPYLNFVYQLSSKVNLKADYHYFALQGKLTDENEKVVDAYLGSEVDLSVQFIFSKQLDLQLGASTMLATKSMEHIKGGSHKEPAYWGWVMLTLKPVFFSSSK